LAGGRVSDLDADLEAPASLRVDLRFSDFGEVEGGVELRTTFPHLGQATSLKSWSGGMTKEFPQAHFTEGLRSSMQPSQGRRTLYRIDGRGTNAFGLPTRSRGP